MAGCDRFSCRAAPVTERAGHEGIKSNQQIKVGQSLHDLFALSSRSPMLSTLCMTYISITHFMHHSNTVRLWIRRQKDSRMGPIYVDAETREEIHIRHTVPTTTVASSNSTISFHRASRPTQSRPPKADRTFRSTEGNLRIFTEGKQFDLVPGETATVAPWCFTHSKTPGMPGW